ncbi:MAG: phosphonate transporter, permease protein PhnE [Chloroflexi bacterium]|nr:phosphonate transporter, permease protein PhnE [Chloroflexota bacterium]
MSGTFERSRLFSVIILGVFLWALASVGLLDAERLGRGTLNLGVFLSALFPPDLSVLPNLGRALVETLQIAIVGTLLGFILAVPMALAATRALFPPMVTVPTRLILSAVRTIPSLLWGIIFVVAVGLGAAAGALGVALYSLGYLGKLLYEAFEGVDTEVVEAVRSAGVGRLQLARYGIIPEAGNVVLSQLLFMFEYNVRASSIMGLVGAGGIGFYLLGYIQMLQYSRLMTALLVTLAAVVLIDYASSLVRRVLVLPSEVQAVA